MPDRHVLIVWRGDEPHLIAAGSYLACEAARRLLVDDNETDVVLLEVQLVK